MQRVCGQSVCVGNSLWEYHIKYVFGTQGRHLWGGKCRFKEQASAKVMLNLISEMVSKGIVNILEWNSIQVRNLK